MTQDKDDGNNPSLTIMNTILSAVGAATCLAILGMFSNVSNKTDITLQFDLMQLVGSIMSGCVAVTAASNNVEPTSAVVIGFVGAIVYSVSVSLFERMEIDDPLQVTQIHGLCGVWGVIAVGIFDKDTGLIYSGQFR